MSYNIEELLALPEEERIMIVQHLLDSISEEFDFEAGEEEAAFVEERLKQHRANPNEGKSLEEFKKYFAEKYGL